MTETPVAISIAYLAAAVMFILGLKFLSSPATARRGNLIAAAGMTLAVAATLFVPGVKITPLLVTGLVVGTVAGLAGARMVPMTDMPQMVAILNGLGGGAAALVSVAEILRHMRPAGVIAILNTIEEGMGSPVRHGASVVELLGVVIGSVSFSGSLVAFAKLQGLVSEKAIAGGWTRWVNIGLATLIVLSGWTAATSGGPVPLVIFALAALAFGATMVMPIGGADMPVVISLLNSFTGLAAAATGFTLDNRALIIAGTLVGAAGTLLTRLMCKAMNRSLVNVLFGGFGAGPVVAAGAGAAAAARPVREIGPEDAAILMANVRSLIVIPGYGMAVAQAQHTVRELADLLARRGVDVKYAIHPVAGRMPGHMNVLLAEANVPYDQLYDLDQINSEFGHTDLALVIGANDVVNPGARNDPQSPIYGMPILDADKAQHVIIIKRSMNPGFAGIDNPLYYDPRTMMLFGDAKGAVSKLVESLKLAA
jgi:H+-translocating NAD(P) transhydrogenase subunit beta